MRLINKLSKSFWILLFVVFIAAFFRFYQLGQNPPSLTWDEAAWGYNAYSLGIDGKDEFGKFLPITYLESFGDFKPVMYAYLDIIPVKLLGLTEFATRFPSALFGTLTVLLTYFLVKRIFYVTKNKEFLALTSALFLAISPWHILLSRAAFEANIASFFLVFGIWSFLAGVQEKKWYLLISAASFALSMYTFNTSRIVAPLLVILLAFMFRKRLWEFRKQTLFAFTLGLLILLPLIPFLFTSQAALRFKEVNIFSDPKVVENANKQIANDKGALWSKIINNRRVLYSFSFVKHYLDNLSPSFLFIKGDGNPKFSTQEVGQMYLWDIPFLVAGFFWLLKKREGGFWLIPIWIILGIIPAATARETPHALRIETTLPAFQIITAYGLTQLIYIASKYKKLIMVCLFSLLFINFFYFVHNYFYQYAQTFSGEWQYGYKDSITYVKTVENKYDAIQITNGLGRPYIYYLFYNKTNPKDFRNTAKINRDPFGFVTVLGYGKFIFPTDYNYNLGRERRILYINTPYNLPKGIHILKTINLLNGIPVLVAYTI